MQLLNIVIGLAIGFAMLITAAPSPGDGFELVNITNPAFNSSEIASTLGYDPSYEWHDYSTVQVWIGKDGVNIGNKVGSSLYDTIWKLLDFMCPSTSHYSNCHGKSDVFHSKCATGGSHGSPVVEDCTIVLNDLYINWESEEIRKLLIGAAAGALQAVTTHNTGEINNCYDMGGSFGKGCMVGSAVRVNMPDSVHKGAGWQRKNRLSLALSNIKGPKYTEWNCCRNDNLALVGLKTDGLQKEILKAFPQWHTAYTRDSRCILNGWDTC